MTPFTAKPSELPPSEGGLDPIGMIVELGRLGKANTAEVLADTSGGRRISFTRLRGLEEAITTLGEELHSQYFPSYTDSRCTPGFHRLGGEGEDPAGCSGPGPIRVLVRSGPDSIERARDRPSYALALR
jgi:hypothetical protein